MGSIPIRKPTITVPYLILKANASHIPLKDESVDVVLATPPYIGARPVGKGAFCTNSPREYKRMIDAFLVEALRIVKAEGYILMSTSRTPAARRPGAVKVVFRIFRKRAYRETCIPRVVAREVFWTHGQVLKRTCWLAIPVKVYSTLLEQYSQPEQIVAHVFSGSGNGGIAAVLLNCKAVLIDLYYHREVAKRLRRKCPRER
jgi:hypothetical protein